MADIRDQIINQLERLTMKQQQEILHHALRLQSEHPPGIPGEELVKRAHEINFPQEDLAEIIQAIEEDSERIDWDGWQ
jgi:hypothetical protein